MRENNDREKKSSRSRMLPFLIVLILIGVISTGIAGFSLGKKTGAGLSGEWLDIITLSPQSSADITGDVVTHFLSGKIVDANGNEYGNSTVSFSGKGEKKSDEHGEFWFSDIRTGKHTIKILDEERRVVASSDIEIDFNAEREIKADITVDEVKIKVPDDTRVLELTFSVDGEKINIDTDSSSIITSNREIINFNSKALNIETGQFVVTPRKNIVSSDGFVVDAKDGNTVTTDGFIEKQTDTNLVVPGLTVDSNGAFITDNGVAIMPDGSVSSENNDFAPEDSSGGIVIIDGEDVEIIPEPPDEYIPLPSPTPVPTPNPDVGDKEAEESNDKQEDDASSEEAETSDDKDDSLNDDDSDTKEEEEDDTGRELFDGKISGFSKDSGVMWTQKAVIDLFKNRNIDLGEEDGIPIIGPGSEGYYEFILENNNDFDIAFDMTLLEETYHLPLFFSIYEYETNKAHSYRQELVENEGVTTPKIKLRANTRGTYRLDWIWDYEKKYFVSEQDAIDSAQGTEIARADEAPKYVVSLVMNVEGLTTYPTIPPGTDEGIKNPGIRPGEGPR